MATALWSTFYPYVLPLVSGCPYPTIDHHLRLAARDFCDRTLCWRAWMDPIRTDASTNRYDLELENGQELVQLLRGTVDGVVYDVLAQDDIPANWQEGTSGRQGIFTPNRVELVVLPQPAASLDVIVEAAMKPSLTATGVDNDLVARHYTEAIALGAVDRIQSMPGRPWTARTSAHDDYEAKVAEVATEVFRSFSRAARRTRAHFM